MSFLQEFDRNLLFLVSPASMLSQSLPLPKLGKNSDHVCPICNSRYSNIGNFKQHMKMHDSDNLKEQRNVIIGEMVATCYGKKNCKVISTLLKN